jgi:type IV pilus assembly protein PilM
MDSYPIAWGLDIGHSTIKAVKLSRTGTGVLVQGYAMEPVTVPDGGDRNQAVLTALQAIAAREEFGSTPVFAAISGRQVYTKSANIPLINQKKMGKMVELEARQQIPGNFDEVEWGYHASPAADGASLDVALFAVKKDDIQGLVERCKTVGIHLAGVSVPSLGLYNFVRYDQTFPDDEAVIILDVGAENADLVVYQGDQLWMRSLAVSGNDLTQTFAKKFRVSVEEAEQLKRQVPDSRQAEKILKVIESGLSDLTSEVNRSLGFYRSQNQNAKLDNLVISGSTFRLTGLPEYMAEKLRLTVNILEDLDKIQVAPGLDRTHFMQDLQSLGVAMGLALQATGASRANVNLLPRQAQAERLLKTKRWAAAAIVGMLGVTLYADYAIVNGIRDTNQKLADTVEKYTRDNKAKAKDATATFEQVKALAPKLARFDVVGQAQGFTHAVVGGVVRVVQTTATDPAISLADLAGTGDTPKAQAAWLRSVDLPGAGGTDLLRPLANQRTCTVAIDIPRCAAQVEIRQMLLKRLREVPVPPELKELIPGERLFSDVQASSDTEGSIDWYFINRQHLDANGSLAPIEERREFATNVTTFTCLVASADSGGGSAAAKEPSP